MTLPDGKSMEQVQSAAQLAVQKLYGDTYPGSNYSWVRATLDGELIVQHGEKQWKHAWSVDADGVVTVAPERAEVVERVTYETVAASLTFEVHGAQAKTGRKLEVRVIGTGEGANTERQGRWFVPATDDGIGSAKKIFGGARVHWHAADGTYDHVEKSLRDWLGSPHDVGYLSDLRVTDDGLFASLNLDDDTPEFVREALVERRVGLSVEAAAERRPVVRDGKKYVELVNWRHPEGEAASVAIVSHPALRGEVLAVAASRKESPMTYEQALAVIASEASSAEDVAKARKVIASHKPAAAPVAAATAVLDPADDPKVALAEIKKERAKTAAETLVRAAKLPEAHADRVIASVNELIDLDATLRGDKLTARVNAAIDAERKLLPAPQVNASGARAEVGAGSKEKLELRIETLFGRNDPEFRKRNIARVFGGKSLEDRRHDAGLPRHESEGSMLRIFREATGHEFSELQTNRGGAVRASIISSTFGDAWENVLNRRFLASFENPDFGDWRKLTRVVPLQNFVKQERIVKGGYANLATVAEGQNYESMTTPADQGHGYTPTKRGGTEDVTWEAWLRDDVGALDVGPAMGMSAARTLYEFVFDLYKSGTVTMDYDSTALYDATHSNTGTTALSSTELIAVYKAMMKQADISNSKRLMVQPKFLLVPIDLMNTAFDLLKSLSTFPGGSTNDYEFIRRLGLEAIVVRHWTDTNNWYLVADPTMYPAAEIGFVGGNEQPELFVQDDRNLGSYFNADKITYKIRHAYGGTILRHETVYGEVVA